MKRTPAVMLSAVLLAAQLIHPALTAAQTTTTIRVRPQQQRGTVSPLIYGTNHRFFANGVGMWDPAAKRSFPKFDQTYDEINLRSLRYPAGTAAHFFEWKKAIGPVEGRGKIHRVDGKPSFHQASVVTFGIDDAARWSAAHGNTMVYMYGIGNSNAREAADLIEYLNAPVGTNPNGGTAWADVRAKNGQSAAYNIRYFEIANEMDGPSQKFWLPHITTAQKEDAAKLASKNLEDKRASYAREYCFGGVAAFTKQPVKLPEDYRDDAAKSDGQPNQIKQVMYFPVELESDTVFVDDEAWRRVPDIRAARGGNVYQVNNETGQIIFGDGKTGAIPSPGKQVTASYRAKRDGFVDYYREMKKVDPSIKVYAGYESKRIISELGAAHPYDGIVVHSYTAPWNFPKRTFASNDFSHRLMLGAEERAAELEEYQTEMRRTVGGKRAENMHVVVTEYGALRLTDTQAEPKSNYVRSLEQGLYVAQLLLGFMRLGMPFAHKHSTISDADGVIGPAPDFIPTATARVFQTFTRMFGDRLVGVETEGNPTRATADDHKLAKLDMEASTDDKGNVYLIVINRDAVDAVPATVDVAGSAMLKEASIWTVDAASFSAYNTAQNPDAVRLKKESLRASGKVFTHVFPAHSLTAIKFTNTGSRSIRRDERRS